MATTDNVIINLLIKEQGTVGAINSQKSLAKQTVELIKLIDNLAARYTVNSAQIVRAIETYNAAVKKSGQGQQVNEKALGMYKLEIDNIKKLQAAQAAADRERAEAQQRRMIGIQQEAIKQNENFERQKLQAAELKKVQDAINSASGPLSGLSGKSPYQQTQLLIPLMKQLGDTTGASTDEMLKLVKSMYGIDSTVIKNVTRGLHDMKNGIVDTAKETFNLKAIMNTAFGVGMAMLIFQIQMAVGKLFTDAIQQAKDFSNAIGKISIAEQVMSKEGIEVTGKELLNIVSELEKEFTNVSNVDMLKATGDMALRLAGTGFTPKELKGLLEVANSAKIRNPEKSLEEIMGTVAAAAMSGQVEGVRNLGGGLSVAASDVQAYALKSGMISDINQKLTEEQKLHARAGVLIEQNNKTLNESLKLQDNLVNSGDKLKASWQNLLEAFAPFVDGLNAVVYLLAYSIQGISTMVGVINGTVEPTNKFQENMQKVLQYAYSMGKFWTTVLLPVTNLIAQGWQAILTAYERVSGHKVSEQPSISNLANQDTPTGIPDVAVATAEENSDKIQKALNDLAEAMDSFGDRARNAEEDFQNSMQKMSDDFNLDRNRFLEDWAIDRQKIIDDAEEEQAKKQREYDKKKLDAEAKLQEDLRQLREKYLMNLDDALHERDARQVLRLAREYAMNKQNLLNEFALRQGQDDNTKAQEIADLQQQTKDKLAALDAENALKLKRMDEDFKIRQKRAIEEHKIEMARLEHEKDDKLRQLANSLAEQLKLGNSGATAIQQMFMSYFGPNGSVGSIMKYGYDTTVAYAKAMAIQLQNIANQYSATMGAISGATSYSTSGLNWNAVANAMPSTSTSTSSGGGGTGIRAVARAKGGVDIANKPTNLIFGEKEPELALTVPLSQLSTLKGGIGGLFGGNSSPSSSVELNLNLSPDLEAKLVKKSVDAVENVVVNVRRNRS